MNPVVAQARRTLGSVAAMLPPRVRDTAGAWAFGLLEIPLNFGVMPIVEELDDRRVVARIPLCWRTKNHLGSMYFGVLATGADVAAGLIAFKLGRETRPRVDLVFKDFHADFVKRATGDVTFTCEDGEAMSAAVREAAETGERLNLPVRVVATIPGRDKPDVVARFTLTLSLKRKR
jgi:acyl-coenzyme A thioesterase PaaI-like protein